MGKNWGTIDEWLTLIFGGGLILGVVFLFLIFSPLISIAAINTIMEQANVNVYIPHNFWTYISIYGLMFVLKSKVEVKVKK